MATLDQKIVESGLTMILELDPESKVDFLQAIAKSIGGQVAGNTIKLPGHIGTGTIKGFKVNPHLQIIIRQYELKDDWVLKGMVGKQDPEMVMIAFHDVFPSKNEVRNRRALPSVQVTTAGLDYQLFLPAKVRMNSIVIAVHAGYLKELLNLSKRNSLLKTIISGNQPLLVEEIISPRIERAACEIVEEEAPRELEFLFYKAKAEELIYLLFHELLKRQDTPMQALNVKDVKVIYQVKDRILSAMDSPPRLNELAKFSGMSESKLKRLFRQIFGYSIYKYYQSMRMKEAAYFLKEKKLMVSEVGHMLGFTNLSHFSRVFESHIGVKPKKYSK